MQTHKRDQSLKLFPEIKKGLFIRRINRFMVECFLNNTKIYAHLPNPGRLWELLFTGSTVYIVQNRDTPARKTRYSVVAVEKNNTPIMLHTLRANTVVHHLIERGKIPGLESAEIIKPEVTVNKSRFDFLLRKDGEEFFLEVKSCTLFGKKIAMFPDAVTERGKRHLVELAELAERGTRSGVVFLVQWTYADFFMPDYHTDYDFARTFYELRNDLMFKAIAIEWKKDLSLGPRTRDLEIPWNLIGQETKDGGSYILILYLSENKEIPVGQLGTTHFKKGYYLYVGSEQKNLKKRIQRHLRKRKTLYEDIDYLRNHADHCVALPVRSSEPLACRIASSLSKISQWSVPEFGVSGCSCDTHLFVMSDNPVKNPQFIDQLLYFRIDRLEKYLL